MSYFELLNNLIRVSILGLRSIFLTTEKGFWMGEKSLLSQRPDYLVCTCMEVMYSQIVDAIEQGCNTFEELSDMLGVGTGCSSCVEEVYEILKEIKEVSKK